MSATSSRRTPREPAPREPRTPRRSLEQAELVVRAAGSMVSSVIVEAVPVMRSGPLRRIFAARRGGGNGGVERLGQPGVPPAQWPAHRPPTPPVPRRRAPARQRVPAGPASLVLRPVAAGRDSPVTARALAGYTGDAFFDPADAPAGVLPGEIIRSRPVTRVAVDGAEAWQSH